MPTVAFFFQLEEIVHLNIFSQILEAELSYRNGSQGGAEEPSLM